jgi:hypothetical protein
MQVGSRFDMTDVPLKASNAMPPAFVAQQTLLISYSQAATTRNSGTAFHDP